MGKDNLLEWDKTEAALRVIKALLITLHNNKPAKEDPALVAWELGIQEVRVWALIIHNRRIACNIARMKALRSTYSNNR